MFKLVVLFALMAVASASLVAPLAYSAHYAPALSVPSAVSYQSRTDVHSKSKPVVAAYAAPVVAAAPAIAYSAPAVAYQSYHTPAVAVPSAVSYQSRTDVHSKPLVATYASYAAPAYAYASYASPVVSAYATPASYGYGYGKLLSSW